MTEIPLRKQTKFFGHIVCLGAALVLGLPLWLIYKLSPDLFVFVLAWIIVRPLYKVLKTIDEEMNL